MLFWAVFLFIIGVFLIVAEFVLPGLICGITAVTCLIASTVIGIKAYPEYAVFIIVGESIGAFAGVVVGLFVLAKTPVGRSLFLDTVQSDDAGYSNMKSDTSLLGATGVVLTALRPAGTIEVAGRRIDAVSDGNFIEEGALVQIAEVHGNRVVVETVDTADTG